MKRRLISILLLAALVGCGVDAAPTEQPATAVTANNRATATLAASATPAETTQPTQKPTSTTRPTKAPPTETPLPAILRDSETGLPGLVRGEITQRPFVVMIDNHPDAYPQTGLDEAVLVFEALAEYGVTRYMAVFAADIAPVKGTIGPVRSARLYFVQWAMGMRGVYTHVGGSPTGLERITADANVLAVNLDALEHDHEETFFWRDYSRFAPHNMYTNQALIDAYNAQRISPETRESDFEQVGFLYELEAPERAKANPINSFGYYFLYSDASISWSYDSEKNRYWRYRAGSPHIDAVSGEQLSYKSVTVMQVYEAPIPGDPKARIDQQVIGEGPAVVFANGTQVAATWRKDTEEGPLRFFDGTDKEIIFPAGPQWIAAIPDINQLWVSE